MSRFPTTHMWTDAQTTVGGVVTFYPTDDGTGSGNPLFAVIDAVQLTPELNTGSISAVPFCAVKTVSADRKTIIANVGSGTVLGVLGATVVAVPDGTKVHALVLGH